MQVLNGQLLAETVRLQNSFEEIQIAIGPCVIITRDLINQYRRTVVVVPLSSSPSAHPPIRIGVNCGGRAAVAVVDQIRSIAQERLQSRIGVLTEPEMEAIGDALQQVLDLI